MKKTLATLAVVSGLCFAQTALACDEPAEISIPDGSAAGEQDMIDAGEAYHQFMIDMQLYQLCLEEEANEDRLRAENADTANVRAMENSYAARHNAASAAMKNTTRKFEKAVADYKAR